MKYPLIFAVGALAGGIAFFAQRRRKARADAALWADATDRVTPLPRHAG